MGARGTPSNFTWVEVWWWWHNLLTAPESILVCTDASLWYDIVCANTYYVLVLFGVQTQAVRTRNGKNTSKKVRGGPDLSDHPHVCTTCWVL